MKRFVCLLALVFVIFLPDSQAIAGPMAGNEAQKQFSDWVQEHGGTHIDFEDLAAGTLLDSQYASLGVTFKSIRNPDGTAISKPVVVILSGGSNEISGTPSWGSGSDGRVAYEIKFANPQRWAGLYRHWHNQYTITRFYNPSGQLIYTFQNYEQAPEGFSKIFFGYLVESDDAAHWISRIECDGDLPAPDNRLVGYTDDLYYGTADVSEAPPFMVTSATATINPAKASQFRIKGQVRGFSLTAAEAVLFEAGIFSEEIPLGSFEKSGQKYTYTGQRGKNGLFVLEIDLAQGTFAATGKNLILSGFTNPLPVKLQAGSFQECSMVRFGVAGTKWTFNSKSNAQYPCVLEEAPLADPNGFFVKTAAKLRIQVTPNPNSALDQSSLKLFRVNENLKTIGKPICTLFDDGKATHGDQQAGDGVYGCIAHFNENAAGELRLAVQAKVRDKVIFSPSATVDLVVKLTQKEIDKTLSANNQVKKIWKTMRAQYGDTSQACQKALPGIRKVDGIKSAVLSSDKETILVTFNCGIKGAFVLPRLPPPGVAGDVFSVKSSLSDNFPNVYEPDQHGHSGAGEGGALQALSQDTPTKCPLGNCKALIYAPFEWEFGNSGDEITLGGRASEYLTNLAAQNGMSFDPIVYCRDQNNTDNNCPASVLDKLTSYGTIVFDTHGTVLDDGNVTLATHDLVSRENLSTGTKQIQFGRNRTDLSLFTHSWWKIVGKEKVDYEDTYYGIGPRFINRLPGIFKKSIVFAGACQSLDNESLANAFIVKGAGAYFGIKNVAPTNWCRDMFGKQNNPGLFNGLIEEGKSAGEAYAAIPDETIGTVKGKHFKGRIKEGDYTVYDCYFLKASQTNDNIAYNCPLLSQYKYAGASLETLGDQLWIYADNSTKEEKDVLFAGGKYLPIEGRWTSGNTFTLNIDKYKKGNSVYTGKLVITLDLEPGSQEIRGIKLFTFVLAEVYTLPEHGYTSIDNFSIGAYNLPAPVVNGDNLVLQVGGSEIGAKYGIKYDWIKYWNNNGQITQIVPIQPKWNDLSNLTIRIQKEPNWQ